MNPTSQWSGDFKPSLKALSLGLLLTVSPILSGPAMAEVLPADRVLQLSDAARVKAVRDWDVTTTTDSIRAEAPEGDLAVLIVDTGKAGTAEAALKIALSRLTGAKDYPVDTAIPRAATDGWDERVAFDFKVPPALHRAQSAIASRVGDRWVVLLAAGAQATFDKRGAAIGTMVASLRSANFVEENFADRKANKLNPQRVATLLDFLRTSMAELQVPGAGVALIEDGKVIWEGGLGTKGVGNAALVDAHTLFAVASNTKPMTTMLLARLVDEGKIGWDQKVTEVYPPFRLGSDATTAQVVMRQLVCACTGLPRKDMELIFAARQDTPASDTFTQLATTEPTSRFGDVFQYNNLMAAAAGYVGGYAAYPDMEVGAAYDKAMQERIFSPLGMKDTTFDLDRAIAGNHADPSVLDLAGKAASVGQQLNRNFFPYRPGGGAWSSAHDMARYVLLELGKGKMPDGTRLVSEANVQARYAQNVAVGEDGWYGMGLQTRHRYGLDVASHGGSLEGYKSNWFALPASGVGIVLLTNSDEGSLLLDPFLRRVIEVLYDARPEAAARVAVAAKASQAGRKAYREGLVFDEKAIRALGLAGRYRNSILGDIHIASSVNGTTLSIGPYVDTIAVQKNQDGTASIVVTGPNLIGVDLTGFNLLVGSANGLRTLTVKDAQHQYVFTEIK